MNIEKKVKLQQKIIDDLQQEKDTLKEENNRLSVDLELEKILPKEAYERVKHLINELEDRKSEYETLIENVKEIQSEYKDGLKEIKTLRAKYKKDMDSVLKSINKSAKKVQDKEKDDRFLDKVQNTVYGNKNDNK